MSEKTVFSPATFTSRYGLGEIVELRLAATQERARDFLGEVLAVSFCKGDGTTYTVRSVTGQLHTFLEAELCMLGVDTPDFLGGQTTIEE
jgi:hypothetical protein